jgi:hypothetical protein
MKYKSKILLALFIILFLTASAGTEGVLRASEIIIDVRRDINPDVYVFKGDLRQTLSRHTVIVEFFEKTSGADAVTKPFMKIAVKKSGYSSYNEWLYETVNRSYFELLADSAKGIIKEFKTAAGPARMVSKTTIPGCEDAQYDSDRIIFLSDTVQAEFTNMCDDPARHGLFEGIAASYKLEGASFSLSYPADIFNLIEGNDPDEELINAAAAGDIKKIEEFIGRGADINARNANAETPLIVAAKNKKKKALKLIAEKGADLNAADNKGISSLMAVAAAGDTGSAGYLMSKGARVRTGFQKSAIEAAEKNGRRAAAGFIKKAFIKKNLDMSAYKSFEYDLDQPSAGLSAAESVIVHILNGSKDHEECATEGPFFPRDILSMNIEIGRAKFKNYDDWLKTLPVRGKIKEFKMKAGRAVLADIMISDQQSGDYGSEQIFFLNDKIQAVFSFMPQDSYLSGVFKKISSSFDTAGNKIYFKYPPEFEAAARNLFDRPQADPENAL